MFCKHCGKEISDTNKFCPECSKPVDGNSNNTPNQSNEPKSKKKGKGCLVAVGIVVVLLIIIIAIAASSGGDTNSDPDPEPTPYTALITEEPEEHGTSEYELYLTSKARIDSETATDEQLQAAVDWLKNNVSTYFSSQENMENTIYFGRLLECAYKDSGKVFGSVGWQAQKTVKYVYRGAETVTDQVTQDNLAELIELVENMPDIIN